MASVATTAAPRTLQVGRVRVGTVVMPIIIVALGFYVVYPLLLILLNSFNVARIAEAPRYGLDNWAAAFSQPRVLQSLGNTVLVYALYMSIGFPIAVLIAWALARIRMPFAHGLEFLFWVSYMLPSLFTTIGWMMLLDPDLGLLNVGIRRVVPGLTEGPFNIFSVPGIVWAHLMSTTVSSMAMLLTPAFRNMDASFEEAGRASGASNLITLARITLPMMVPPMAIVLMLNVVRMFQTFEIEQIVGTPFRFYVYSTLIYQLARASEPPQYGQATALASLTLVLIALIIPLQRWLLQRRQVTTVTGRFRPGLIDIGRWRWLPFVFIVAVLLLLNVVPLVTVVLGSFMTRAGFFQLAQVFTLRHWTNVLMDNQFRTALFNTLFLSGIAAVVGPFLFSFIAYVLVRTRWRGRTLLESIVWSSGAVPGILASLWLLALEFASGGTTQREEAGIIGLIIVVMTVGVALTARAFGGRLGVRHA